MGMSTGKPAIVRVRVRGIYATALTKIFLEEGLQIVQPSNLIVSRFNIPQNPAPADVTVKSVENDPSQLLIIGYPWAVDVVFERLQKYVRFSPCWRSKLGLYSTAVVKLKGWSEKGCLAEVNGVLGVVLGLSQEECVEGKLLKVFVSKAPVKPGELARFTPGVRVVGDYAMLYKSNEVRVTISEHVRGVEKKALLQALAASLLSMGVGVHWRSSAKDADENVLRQHLDELYAELERVDREAQECIEKGETKVLTPGESIIVCMLSHPDKLVLDEIRDQVIPTVRGHHWIKSMQDDTLEVLVDFTESLAEELPEVKKLSYNAFLKYIASQLEGEKLRIEHVKLDGSVITLGTARVVEARYSNGKLALKLLRTVTTPGVYDGLGVEKEPGDYIETIVETGEWYVIHRYYSKDGQLKGTYININTPPEVSLTRITYIDLEVDVVKLPGEKPRVIDMEKLEKYHKEGIISKHLYEKAKQVVEQLTR